MSVHYPKNFVGRCKQAKMVPVTIAIGADLQWQGAVTPDEQIDLLALMTALRTKHPASDLPPAKPRAAKASAGNGQPTSDRPATGIPAAQPTSAKPAPVKGK